MPNQLTPWDHYVIVRWRIHLLMINLAICYGLWQTYWFVTSLAGPLTTLALAMLVGFVLMAARTINDIGAVYHWAKHGDRWKLLLGLLNVFNVSLWLYAAYTLMFAGSIARQCAHLIEPTPAQITQALASCYTTMLNYLLPGSFLLIAAWALSFGQSKAETIWKNKL